MKIASVLMTAFVFIGGFAHAMNNGDQYSFSCVSTDGQKLTTNFTVDFTTHTVNFSDIGAFQQRQMQDNTAFGFTWTAFNADGSVNDQATDNNVLAFTYTWYYDANYYVDFSKSPLRKINVGQTVALELSGSDDDGPGGIDVPLSCVVK